jgi:hypothetical protein
LSPDIQRVAKALAGKDRIRLQPLTLTPQTYWVIRTGAIKGGILDERSFRDRENRTARNKIAPHDASTMAAGLSGLLMQALRRAWVAKIITEQRMGAPERNALPATERKQLIKDLPLAPVRRHPLFRELAENGS